MAAETQAAHPSRRAELLLGVGAALGLALAAASLLASPDSDGLAEDVVARVNGTSIRRADYLRAVAALAADRRNPLTESDRRHVLDRLIDEELLVQHALALGLAEHDRRVRADLVSAVMGSLLAAVDGFDPSDSELARFYEENVDYFSRPGRLRVRQIFLGMGRHRGEEEARRLSREAATLLAAGNPFDDVKRQLGDDEVAPLPDTLLPPTKLASYLGPSVLRAASDLEVGATSGPIRSAQGFHVLWLVDREPSSAPALAEIEEQVRSEMTRRHGDEEVRRSLESLRMTGDVVVADALP